MELERIPAASAMDWSIDLDKGLRSRQPATRVHAVDAAGPRLRQLCTCATAPAPGASAYGVLPGEARVFAKTMLLRLATEFRTADGAMRARIVKTLLNITTGPVALARARVTEPDQLLRRVKEVYDTGNKHDRAPALCIFGCFADFAKDSVHVRSLILSSLGASSALEVKAAIFAAGCICHLSGDFSRIILEVFRRLICSQTSEPQVIMEAIKAFWKLDSTLAVIRRVHEVGKQMVLGTLEDVFKSEMHFSLSRLSSKSIISFSDQHSLVEENCGFTRWVDPRPIFSHAQYITYLQNRIFDLEREVSSGNKEEEEEDNNNGGGPQEALCTDPYCSCPCHSKTGAPPPPPPFRGHYGEGATQLGMWEHY